MTEYDAGYKMLFSHKRMVQALILGFVREEWVDKLDFDSLECLSGERVTDDLRTRHNDVIWRVRLSDEWLYVYILLEFQSTIDRFMAVRVLTYMGLLYQDIIDKKWLTKKGLLPPVLPIVLYNGERRWNAETNIDALIENIPGNLAKYGPRLEYLLIDEGIYEHHTAESLKNLVAALFQLENTPVKEMSREIIIKLIDWLKDNKALQRAFFIFIDRIYFRGRLGVERLYKDAKDTEEVATMLHKNVDRFIEEWKAEGHAKGHAKGRAEGRAEGRTEGRTEGVMEVAKNLLIAGMPIPEVSNMTGLSEDELKKLRKSIAN